MVWTETKDGDSVVESQDWNDMADQVVANSGNTYGHIASSNIHYIPKVNPDGDEVAPDGSNNIMFSGQGGTYVYSGANTVIVSSSTGSVTDLYPYMVYDSAGGQTITTGLVKINMDNQIVPNSNYELLADTITVSRAGKYQITYLFQVEWYNRANHTIETSINAGGSAVISSYSYLVRESKMLWCIPVINTFIVTLSADDEVYLQARLTDGDQVATLANRSHIAMVRLG